MEELKRKLLEQSEPLEDATVPQPIEEFSDEDLELAMMGIQPEFSKHFTKQFPDKKRIYQGYPTNDFFDWYLDRIVEQVDLDALLEHKEKFRESQIVKLENHKLAPMDANQTLVARYIEKNAELIKEKDVLFKKVQQLQEERDNLQKKLDNVGAIQEAGAEGYIKTIEEKDKYYNLCKEFVEIFIRNGVEDNISDENYELVNQIIKEVSK